MVHGPQVPESTQWVHECLVVFLKTLGSTLSASGGQRSLKIGVTREQAGILAILSIRFVGWYISLKEQRRAHKIILRPYQALIGQGLGSGGVMRSRLQERFDETAASKRPECTVGTSDSSRGYRDLGEAC